MSINLQRPLFGAMMVVTLTFGLPRAARAVSIDATADTWIRQSAPDTDYGNDWISVRANPSDIRYGIVEFDLSSTIGTPITTATLELFDSSGDGSETFQQTAFLLSPTPPEIDGYTWQEYVNFDQQFEASLESLGAYTIMPGEFQPGYNISDSATAADSALLESIRDANGGRVVFVLKGLAGDRDWLDIERNSPPRLWVNQAVPVFGDLNGDGEIDASDLSVITDPSNWLQTVPAGTRGDLAGNGFVGLDDFHAFKQVYLESQGQSPTQGIPEPASLIAFLSGISGVVFSRMRLLPKR